MKLSKKLVFASMLLTGFASYAGSQEDALYCINHGGTVEIMVAEFSVAEGTQHGFAKPFCTFSEDGGFINIGLQTFSSNLPNIAASFIKTLGRIDKNSPLWIGKYTNPSLNVCSNLGGANIGFNAGSGGFSDKLGQSDVCVFGDGSMVSTWSLIYMANGRPGYDRVKNAVKSEPLSFSY